MLAWLSIRWRFIDELEFSFHWFGTMFALYYVLVNIMLERAIKCRLKYIKYVSALWLVHWGPTKSPQYYPTNKRCYSIATWGLQPFTVHCSLLCVSQQEPIGNILKLGSKLSKQQTSLTVPFTCISPAIMPSECHYPNWMTPRAHIDRVQLLFINLSLWKRTNYSKHLAN